MANGKAGAPIGNTNARGKRTWAEAINKAVKEIDPDSKDKVKKLRSLARKLVSLGIGGDVSALREIGDRLDGRAIQQVDIGDHKQITVIERVIITGPIEKPAIPPAMDVLEHDSGQDKTE